MKKNIILAVFCLILSAISFAQVPQKMSYQAVVRGSDNNLVTNHQVAMRVSILHGSADGTAVYTETHSATTNANGLLTIEIGDGTSNDNFTAINWANGPFFVKTETDVNGGDDYDIIGVSQLLSVPYAMYAQTAGNMPDVSVFLTVETDPTIPDWAKTETKPTYTYEEIENTPDLFDGNYNSLTNRPELFSGSYEDLTNRPELFSGSYEDLTNKPELFDGNYNNLTNTPDLSGYLTSYTESQTLADAAALGNSVNTQLKNVTDPTDAQDAVTLAYLDAKIAELNEKIEQLQELMNTPESALKGKFSISDTSKVRFSKGNLQYQASTNTWRFAENQWDCVGETNANISSSYSGWIDLFGWGTGSNPTNSSTSNSSYSTFTDWGNNAISNGGNQGGLWCTLTKDEWSYLLGSRPNAASLVGKATVNGVTGLVFLPDNWTLPSGCSFTSGTGNAFTANTYTTSQWSAMESAGAVFLPAAGYRLGTSVSPVGSYGRCWSSTAYDSDDAWYLYFGGSGAYMINDYRNFGLSVRLVRVVQN